MRIRLTVLSAIFVALLAACANSGPSKVGVSPMGLGDMHKHDPLLDADCRVPCTISPGPGCC